MNEKLRSSNKYMKCLICRNTGGKEFILHTNCFKELNISFPCSCSKNVKRHQMVLTDQVRQLGVKGVGMLNEKEKSECLLHRMTLLQLYFLLPSTAALGRRFLTVIVGYRELHLRPHTASITKGRTLLFVRPAYIEYILSAVFTLPGA